MEILKHLRGSKNWSLINEWLIRIHLFMRSPIVVGSSLGSFNILAVQRTLTSQEIPEKRLKNNKIKLWSTEL